MAGFADNVLNYLGTPEGYATPGQIKYARDVADSERDSVNNRKRPIWHPLEGISDMAKQLDAALREGWAYKGEQTKRQREAINADSMGNVVLPPRAGAAGGTKRAEGDESGISDKTASADQENAPVKVASQAVDIEDPKTPAALRTNNPGAMIPNPSAAKFGSNTHEVLKDGNKIAKFDDPVNGAAAQFHLLSSKYVGKTAEEAMRMWTNGKAGAEKIGLPKDTIITPEFLKSDAGIAMAQKMAHNEAGGPYPLKDEQWRSARDKAFGTESPQNPKVASADSTFAPSIAGERPNMGPLPTGNEATGAAQPTNVPGTQVAQAQPQGQARPGQPPIPIPGQQHVNWGQIIADTDDPALKAKYVDMMMQSKGWMQIPMAGGVYWHHLGTGQGQFVPTYMKESPMKVGDITTTTMTKATAPGEFTNSGTGPMNFSGTAGGGIPESVRQLQAEQDAHKLAVEDQKTKQANANALEQKQKLDTLELKQKDAMMDVEHYNKYDKDLSAQANESSQITLPALKMAERLASSPEFIAGWQAKNITAMNQALSKAGYGNTKAEDASLLFDKVMAGNMLSGVRALAHAGVGRVLAKEVELTDKANSNRDMSHGAIRAAIRLNIDTHKKLLAVREQADNYIQDHGALDKGFDRQIIGWNKRRMESPEEKKKIEEYEKLFENKVKGPKMVPHPKFPDVMVPSGQ